MVRLDKCELCEKKVSERYILPDSKKKVCRACYVHIQDDAITNELNFDTPQNVVWMGKVAKMGNARAFFIPKSQRPFLKLHQDYLIIIKKLEAKT